jgi:hypothetical protein
VSNVGSTANCHFSATCGGLSANLEPGSTYVQTFVPTSSCPSLEYKMVNENYIRWAQCNVVIVPQRG